MATSRGPRQNEKINNGWRVHPVHCPVRLHYRKWRCLNEIFIETLSVDRKCFFYTINGVSEYFSVSSMFFYIH